MKKNVLITIVGLCLGGAVLYKLKSTPTEAPIAEHQAEPLSENNSTEKLPSSENLTPTSKVTTSDTEQQKESATGDSQLNKAVSPDSSAHDSLAQTSEGIKSAEDNSLEEKLQANIQKDEKLKKEADVNSINCDAKGCTIDASAKKEDTSHFQMAFVEFLQAHPEYGNKIDIKPSEDNPRNVTFHYYKD